MEIPRRWGISKDMIFNGKYEPRLEFSEGGSFYQSTSMGGVWTFSERTQSQPSQLPAEFIDPVSTLWSVKKYCHLIICQVFVTLHQSYFQIYTYFLTTGWCETLSKIKKSHSDQVRAWNVEVQPSFLCPKHRVFMLGHPIFHKSKGHVFMFAYFIIMYSNDY